MRNVVSSFIKKLNYHYFMKKYISLSLIVATAVTFSTVAIAQEKNDKKEEIRVRVERVENGKKTVTEKVIDASKMSEQERQATIEAMQDSLSMEKQQQVKVIIEDNQSLNEPSNKREYRFKSNDEDVIIEGDIDENQDIRVYRRREGAPRVKVYKYNDQEGHAPRWEEDFNFQMDRMGDRMQRLGNEIPRRFDFRGPAYRWDDQLLGNGVAAPTVRSLDVFPNRPNNNILNVRFFAPDEGDVTIRVIDIEGKTVAEENVKSFKGEYVGQVGLKKNAKGTFFVIVTQNGDGISQRIVVE